MSTHSWFTLACLTFIFTGVFFNYSVSSCFFICVLSKILEACKSVCVSLCVRVWLNPIHLSDTRARTHMDTRASAYTHMHTTTAQLTIILMPICLIVGFLIPRAASSFQQGLTVLARDGLSLCVCVCARACTCV